jgi:hypothetical protein
MVGICRRNGENEKLLQHYGWIICKDAWDMERDEWDTILNGQISTRPERGLKHTPVEIQTGNTITKSDT